MSQPIAAAPPSNKLEVLLFAADPRSASGKNVRLLLDEEIHAIRDKIKRAKFRDRVEVHDRGAVRTSDLLETLREIRPQVVHFSGHGERDGIAVVGDDGEEHFIPARGLASLFRVRGASVCVVVLNACYSLPLAEALAEQVGCAIGTANPISDPAAITFGSSFYYALACGDSVQAAFDEAVAALDLKDTDQAEYPQIRYRHDVDPNALFLIPPETATPEPPAPPPPPPPPPSRLRWIVPLAAVIAIAVICAVVLLVGKNTLEAAKRRYAAGNYAGAFPRFKRLAELDNSEAKGFLGIMYVSGLGTAEDDSAGFYWLTEAAKDGDRRGMYALGIAYETGEGVAPNPREAMRWYADAERKGYADAMNKIGELYRRGAPGITQNYNFALQWFGKAAHGGSVDGMSNLAFMHELGLAGTPNLDEALRWHRRGAQAGSTRAMVDLGWVHEHGIGVRANPDSAAYWYLQAAQAEDKFGMNNLAVLYATGRGVPRRDCPAARDWFRKAADLDLPEARENLARIGDCRP